MTRPKPLDLVRLARPHYTIALPLAYLLTVWYACGGQMIGRWTSAGVSTAALSLMMVFGYVLNDLCDVAVDRVNAPSRPLAAGRISRQAAWALAGVALVGGLALGVLSRWAFAAVLGGVAVGLTAYDLLGKRLGPGKHVAVAALTACIYPLAIAQAGGVRGSRAWTLAIFPAWLFVTAFGYELLKDLRDSVGDDRATGRVGHLQRRPRLWRRIASASVLLGAILLIGPALTGCRWVYMAVAVGAMAAAAVSVLLPIRKAIAAVYLECLLVGVAATADVIVFGP